MKKIRKFHDQKCVLKVKCFPLIFHLFIGWMDVNNQISTSILYPPISKLVYELSKADTPSEDGFHATREMSFVMRKL